MKKTILSFALTLLAFSSFCQTKDSAKQEPKNVQIRYVAVFSPEDIQDLTMFMHNLDMYSDKGRTDIVSKFLNKFRIVQIPDSVSKEKPMPQPKKKP